MSNERELIVWSVAWGDYSYMLQSLVTSLRRTGYAGKIVVFCDRQIKDAECHPIDPVIDLDQLQFWKFEYLCKHMANQPGRDLVFIDSDHYVVRDVSDHLPKLLEDGPWHSFLEGPINTAQTQRGDWWGCPNSEFVKLCRDFGVMQREIRNSNGGFWAVRSEFAETSRKCAKEFHELARKRGHVFPEEVSIAVMSHIFSEDHQARFAERWSHLWASEWTGALNDRVPDGNPWKMVNYMSGETVLVNPAIVHAMRSKSALISMGRNILGDVAVMSEPQRVSAMSSPVNAMPQEQKKPCSACARKRQQMLEAKAKAELENAVQSAADTEDNTTENHSASPDGSTATVVESSDVDSLGEQQYTAENDGPEAGTKTPSLMERLKGMISG
jgi:hypothetical protein